MGRMLKCKVCGEQYDEGPNKIYDDGESGTCSNDCFYKSKQKQYPEHPHPDSVDLTVRVADFDEYELNMAKRQREETCEKILRESIKSGESPEKCTETMAVVCDMNLRLHEIKGVYTDTKLAGKTIVVEFKKQKKRKNSK